jgi:hypothetical protein
MRQHPPRCQARQGVARNRRPVRLAAQNDNEAHFGEPDEWRHLGDIAAQVARRWWLDE